LHLAPISGLPNPVLAAEDVTDVEAAFVADPFMIRDGNAWAMFFEVLNMAEEKGQIGLATSPDGLRWTYRRIVLAEPFHLSYPYVFRCGAEIYLIPESLGTGGIWLYRAAPFPERWERVAMLVPGVFADASILHHDGLWWLFACSAPFSHDALRLYCAEALTEPWWEHPASPLVVDDNRRARPGGRVTIWNGRLLRFAQDCKPRYGSAVRAFEIIELTPSSYREREATAHPILRSGHDGWNRVGMHHVDPHEISDRRWIACVDGSRPRRQVWSRRP
jgi:hypothetical protein